MSNVGVPSYNCWDEEARDSCLWSSAVSSEPGLRSVFTPHLHVGRQAQGNNHAKRVGAVDPRRNFLLSNVMRHLHASLPIATLTSVISRIMNLVFEGQNE